MCKRKRKQGFSGTSCKLRFEMTAVTLGYIHQSPFLNWPLQCHILPLSWKAPSACWGFEHHVGSMQQECSFFMEAESTVTVASAQNQTPQKSLAHS